jgi:glycosyltransferase involved in cell wall biosynthesis
MRSLVDACANHRVTIIDKVIDRADVYALFQACDCLLSLHRAEGFGLTLAEAMYLGKPVIATGYSGNMDFTTPTNSFLAGYRLVPVPPNCDPYPTTAYWAEPSVADAVGHLRVVRDHPHKREEVARAGMADIRQFLSAQTVGQEIRSRLERLHALANQ